MSTFFRDDRSISEEDLVRSLIRAGGNRFEESAREKATNAFQELSERADAIGTTKKTPVALYPFKLDGTVLKLGYDPFGKKRNGLLYSFLLTATRASMESTSRTLNKIDPTALFEEVCAESLCEFWGGRTTVSDVMITGTSQKNYPRNKKGRFPSMIDNIAKNIKEGVGWKESAKSPGAGDGGLDLVVWRRFKDERPSGLVGFAQCKTGEFWRDHLGKNNPKSICHEYFTVPLVLSPLPIYMVPCRVENDEWTNIMLKHKGILFDRCRISTFGTKLTNEIISRCESWLRAAIDREKKEIDRQEQVALEVASGEAK
jgi:hypothetical protein